MVEKIFQKKSFIIRTKDTQGTETYKHVTGEVFQFQKCLTKV